MVQGPFYAKYRIRIVSIALATQDRPLAAIEAHRKRPTFRSDVASSEMRATSDTSAAGFSEPDEYGRGWEPASKRLDHLGEGIGTILYDYWKWSRPSYRIA